MKKSFLKNLMGILLALFCQYAYAQNRTITGTVTSKDDGLPVPGVSVTVKGTHIGTQTSASGKFSINVPSSGTTLVFTFIGFAKTEMPIGSTGVVNVALANDFKQLSEVVVTGSGVATSKAKLGISVEAVAGKSLSSSPQASIDQGLIGQVAGAQISSVDGTPGAKTNIVLRGINTVQGSTSPMILVDGIESRSTDISQLDPATVDHIEIVQGAAASTIYGAQGANGVIQVFTKKGKLGKARIDITSSVSAGDYLNIGDVHQAKLSSFKVDASGVFIDASGNPVVRNQDGRYLGIQWAYGADPSNGHPTAMSNPLNIAHQQYGTNLKYYDHLAQLFKTAYTTNNSAAISGANDNSDYNLTISNNHQQSNIRNNGYNDRTNLTANIGAELFKGFTIRSITQLIYTKNTLNPNYGIGNAGGIFDVLNASPYYDFNQKNADGSYPLSLNSGTVSVNGSNPNYYTQWANRVSNREDILQNIQADYKINKFITLNAKYGINYQHTEQNTIYKNQSGTLTAIDLGSYYGAYAANPKGELDKNTSSTTFQNFNASAIIKTDFEKDFHINLPITTSTLVGYDYRKNVDKQYNTYGLELPEYAIYNFNQTATQAVAYDYTTPFITYGFYVNQKIDFGDYGGVAGGFRSDYSSAFGGGSKPFTFPNANGYIRPSSFDFWKNSTLGNVIPEFKLRGGYGEAGTQPMPFDRYPTINPGNLGSALTFNLPTSLANPNLKVEVSKEYEIGTDIAIKGASGNWFSEINVSGTYWNRKSDNVIYNINTAPSTGGNQIKTNAIGLSSHGIQASLNIGILKTRDFNWNFTTNFSKATTMITSTSGAPIILNTAAGSTFLTLTAGQKIGQIFGNKALTSLSETNSAGVPYILPADYSKYTIVDGRVVNIATKGIQFASEASSFGDPNPKFNAAFINNFTYKSLSFGFQFDWVYGSHLYNQTREWQYRDGISGDYDKAVNIAGTSAAYTAYYRSAYADIIGGVNGARNGTKDYFYEGASFLRLRNVYLGYDFSRLISKKVFKRAVLTFTGRNLLTFTKYTGFDPEISSGTSNSPFDRGVDHDSTPNSKSYQVGLNLGF
ncbi:SusC/RagA family TonB-linked outer membrane protein [Mucilaginibacter sp. KACC 22773]|jgi:TonB-linked SusC/RagA family outer membrane protein|uniref:SusC/RagA family TonB-linked outer membrane protein n=1 Tax=Mucilaginibacter sp. KACC 22773 TaxID=3025671 RepID=UPI002366ED6E|nr:SusC/RagA family TonB-linked outer membrane protein [Mucilaginibacter sp. KACC 22773]WDF77858.1 SusC/RagA family TonB-linked outer membrane protein [Mucilaginibacter sp. KACC 22773]